MERTIGCVTAMNELHFPGSEERLGGGGDRYVDFGLNSFYYPVLKV
jgi:hypothetical protein